MTTIPQNDAPCQDIPFYTEAEIHRNPEAVQPIATPLADFLAASYQAGDIDTAAADAEIMTYEEWLANEPAWDYWEEYEEAA